MVAEDVSFLIPAAAVRTLHQRLGLSDTDMIFEGAAHGVPVPAGGALGKLFCFRAADMVAEVGTQLEPVAAGGALDLPGGGAGAIVASELIA